MNEGGKVSQSDIDRANSNIVEVIRQHVPIKKTGKNWSACCPFHQENTPSFTVCEEKKFFYCFGCGAGGNSIDFVMEHTGASFREAVESINGGLTLESSSEQRPAAPRAITCTLPGHAENREKSARIMSNCDAVPQHPYFLKNNTAPQYGCFMSKGFLLAPMFNNIGENTNVAAISVDGAVTYAAGKPSFGSTAIIEPASQHDGVTIICADYAHAWRIWWKRSGKSRVLCTMSADNLLWMLANCRDRFTHVGCDPSQAEEFEDMGHKAATLPIDPYKWLTMTL